MLVMAVCVLLQVAVFSRLHISGAGPDIALVAALAVGMLYLRVRRAEERS